MLFDRLSNKEHHTGKQHATLKKDRLEGEREGGIQSAESERAIGENAAIQNRKRGGKRECHQQEGQEHPEKEEPGAQTSDGPTAAQCKEKGWREQEQCGEKQGPPVIPVEERAVEYAS